MSFTVEVLSPLSKVYSGEVTEVLIPAYDGEVGVLPDHEDFIGVLGTGQLLAKNGKQQVAVDIENGVYKVVSGDLVILAETASLA